MARPGELTLAPWLAEFLINVRPWGTLSGSMAETDDKPGEEDLEDLKKTEAERSENRAPPSSSGDLGAGAHAPDESAATEAPTGKPDTGYRMVEVRNKPKSPKPKPPKPKSAEVEKDEGASTAKVAIGKLAVATVKVAKEDGAKEDGAKEDGAKEDGAKEDGAKEDGAKEDGAEEDGAKEDVDVDANGPGSKPDPQLDPFDFSDEQIRQGDPVRRAALQRWVVIGLGGLASLLVLGLFVRWLVPGRTEPTANRARSTSGPGESDTRQQEAAPPLDPDPSGTLRIVIRPDRCAAPDDPAQGASRYPTCQEACALAAGRPGPVVLEEMLGSETTTAQIGRCLKDKEKPFTVEPD